MQEKETVRVNDEHDKNLNKKSPQYFQRAASKALYNLGGAGSVKTIQNCHEKPIVAKETGKEANENTDKQKRKKKTKEEVIELSSGESSGKSSASESSSSSTS